MNMKYWRRPASLLSHPSLEGRRVPQEVAKREPHLRRRDPVEERALRIDPQWRQRSAPRIAKPASRHGWLRTIVIVVALVLFLPVAAIALYRVVPPPITPLMLIRAGEGEQMRRVWVPLTRMSPNLLRAVVTSEDQKFCFHRGFDWDSLNESWQRFEAGEASRGASTITMQTAKNLFLWPERSLLRKGIEAYLTVWIELLWPKERILETYLNVIEWGHGIYGAEAAANLYFNKRASALTAEEAALLAAVLPNPRRFSVQVPSPYVEERAAAIRARMFAAAIPGHAC
jgi:monofunctional biosynthetic peptidoglycan transglycosylase